MSLIVVDIQPEYQSHIPFLRDFVSYINKTKQPITFLYNGQETLGMVSESDYKWWLIENGVDEDVIDSATFYDKGYAFFRYCMDKGFDHDEIVGLVKLMYDSGVNDSRELDDEFWAEYIFEHEGSENLREALHYAEDCIHIPDLMDFLQPYTNITICGGGVEQCLKEVEIGLDALGKKYKVLHQYTYQKGGKMLKTGGISDFDYGTLGEDTFAHKILNAQGGLGADAQEYIKHIENKRLIFSHESTIKFTEKEQSDSFKPIGLWYGIELGWLDWVSSEMPYFARRYEHLHEIKVTDKVLRLNTIGDAESFTEKYGEKKGYSVISINWERVAQDYSGIEVKDPYTWCRQYDDELGWLYPWDVPSGCVWKADGIESITLIKSHDKLKNGGNVDGKTFLQFSSHRARGKFGKMGIPHEKYVSTKSWNHYTVVSTKDVDKILEYVKKGVKVVKAKINEDELVRPWKEKGGGVANFLVDNYEPFKYTIGGL
jgi:hypothetical protein